MKLKREYLVGLLVIIFAGLYFFTPIGFHAKIYLNRLVSHNPTPVAEREQQFLEDYHWELEDADGDPFNLETYKGKVILMNFWASWCPPCVAEMPGFQQLYNDYGEQVGFLFIARDKKDKASGFMERKGYELPVFYEDGFTPRVLFSAALPTTYVIDRHGKIVMAEVGARDWNSTATRSFLDGVLSE